MVSGEVLFLTVTRGKSKPWRGLRSLRRGRWIWGSAARFSGRCPAHACLKPSPRRAHADPTHLALLAAHLINDRARLLHALWSRCSHSTSHTHRAIAQTIIRDTVPIIVLVGKARFGEPHTLTRPCVHAGAQAWRAPEPRSLTCAGKLRAPWSNLLPLDPWDDSDILRETHLGTCWPTWRRARKAWPNSDRHARIGDNLQRARVAILCMCYLCAVDVRCMGTSTRSNMPDGRVHSFENDRLACNSCGNPT